MYPRERAADFISHFQALVREYEDMEDAEKLSSRTLTTDFYNAVREAVPGVSEEWRSYRTINEKEMSFEKLKSTLINIEAENREYGTSRKEHQPYTKNRENQRPQQNNQTRTTSARYSTKQLADLNWNAIFNPALKAKSVAAAIE